MGLFTDRQHLRYVETFPASTASSSRALFPASAMLGDDHFSVCQWYPNFRLPQVG